MLLARVLHVICRLLAARPTKIARIRDTTARRNLLVIAVLTGIFRQRLWKLLTRRIVAELTCPNNSNDPRKAFIQACFEPSALLKTPKYSVQDQHKILYQAMVPENVLLRFFAKGLEHPPRSQGPRKSWTAVLLVLHPGLLRFSSLQGLSRYAVRSSSPEIIGHR